MVRARMARIPLSITLALIGLGALLALVPALSQASSARVNGGHEVRKNIRLYDGVWRRNVQPPRKRWARRVADCESGRNPNALGYDGKYRGAFQFSLSTWRHAPRSPGGDPVAYSYRTQAFVAVRLMRRDGKGHWPSCG
jgi:hypothetical protein